MISGHGANPIFFNKENKDWTSRTLANPPHAKSDNTSILNFKYKIAHSMHFL